MHKWFQIGYLAIFGGVVIVLAMLATACGSTNNQLQSQRKASVKARAKTFEKAQSVAPLPHPSNFPLRKALVEFTERQDMEHHPWYTYILGMNGNVVGYYVTKTVPVNACDFLSSTEVVDSTADGKVVLTAPSLDGVFYGRAQCDSWFFFDYATNALIQIRGVNWYSSDRPLKVEAQAITVKKGKS